MRVQNKKYKMKNKNVLYDAYAIMGSNDDALHPGGLALTGAGMKRTCLPVGAKILDIGCGCGNTVKFLRDCMSFQSYGVDVSASMIETALLTDDSLQVQVASANALPFANATFDGVLAECVFCLLEDKPQALQEIYRVLKPGGKVLFSDLYLKSPAGLPVNLSGITCLQDLQTRDKVNQLVCSVGFASESWQDCHDEYLGFLGQLIFNSETVDAFWQCVLGNCEELFAGRQRLERKKISYYSAIWQKPVPKHNP